MSSQVIGKQHGKCGRIVQIAQRRRGKRGEASGIMTKKMSPPRSSAQNHAASVVAILPRQAGAGHTVAPPNVPLFSLRGRTVAMQSINGAILRREFVHRHAKFCRKPLCFFCYVRRRLTKRTAKGIALCLRLKKPKAFFTGQTCRTPCRTRKVLPPCGQHFYIKACRYLPKNRKKNKK